MKILVVAIQEVRHIEVSWRQLISRSSHLMPSSYNEWRNSKNTHLSSRSQTIPDILALEVIYALFSG